MKKGLKTEWNPDGFMFVCLFWVSKWWCLKIRNGSGWRMKVRYLWVFLKITNNNGKMWGFVCEEWRQSKRENVRKRKIILYIYNNDFLKSFKLTRTSHDFVCLNKVESMVGSWGVLSWTLSISNLPCFSIESSIVVWVCMNSNWAKPSWVDFQDSASSTHI